MSFRLPASSQSRSRQSCAAVTAGLLLALSAAAAQPNILWISSEDHGQHMGCYGDTYATTPNLDKFAATALRYRHVWAVAPVCAPTRTTIISGLYGPSSGGDHMRSSVAAPAGVKFFPQLLREAGYYTSNNAKEDYNLRHPGKTWDDSSGKGHWRNRPAGAPFFSVFNSNRSHEGQTSRGGTPKHDPAKARVPAYHPDTPVVRKDWALYNDGVTAADADAGALLAQLDADGLAEDTIVFYWADHGPGLPRSKRWPSDSGLRVPLMIRIPEKFRHLRPAGYAPGAASERLVSFADLAPTMCSLAGIAPPAWMQGAAFLGPHAAPPREFLHGFRGRMDERYDFVRSVTDGRFVYLRNFLPHLSQAQHVGTQFKMPTTVEWRKLYDEGKLNAGQRIFWQVPKSTEELYDLASDPDEVNNLALAATPHPALARLRAAVERHAAATGDLGVIPEAERERLWGATSPRDASAGWRAAHLATATSLARRASDLAEKSPAPFAAALAHADATHRYWGVLGLRIRGAAAIDAHRAALRARFADESPSVRIAAAEALAALGSPADLAPALDVLIAAADCVKTGLYSATEALNALETLGEKSRPLKDRIAALPREVPSAEGRIRGYPGRLIAKTLENLQ